MSSDDTGSSAQPAEEGTAAPEVHFYTPGDFRAPLPSMEDALSPDEKAKLDALDPRIRKAFVQGWEYSAPMAVTVPDPGDPGAEDQTGDLGHPPAHLEHLDRVEPAQERTEIERNAHGELTPSTGSRCSSMARSC